MKKTSKNKPNTKYKLGIQFNTDDPRQRTAVNFLSLCGYKKNKLLGIIVEEFIERHGLNDADSEYLKQFVDSYDFIISAANITAVHSYQPMIAQPQTTHTDAGLTQEQPVSTKHETKKTKQPQKTMDSKSNDHEKIQAEITQKPIEYDKDKANAALSAFGL